MLLLVSVTICCLLLFPLCLLLIGQKPIHQHSNWTAFDSLLGTQAAIMAIVVVMAILVVAAVVVVVVVVVVVIVVVVVVVVVAVVVVIVSSN